MSIKLLGRHASDESPCVLTTVDVLPDETQADVEAYLWPLRLCYTLTGWGWFEMKAA